MNYDISKICVAPLGELRQIFDDYSAFSITLALPNVKWYLQMTSKEQQIQLRKILHESIKAVKRRKFLASYYSVFETHRSGVQHMHTICLIKLEQASDIMVKDFMCDIYKRMHKIAKQYGFNNKWKSNHYYYEWSRVYTTMYVAQFYYKVDEFIKWIEYMKKQQKP